jgi:hypothetical protein
MGGSQDPNYSGNTSLHIGEKENPPVQYMPLQSWQIPSTNQEAVANGVQQGISGIASGIAPLAKGIKAAMGGPSGFTPASSAPEDVLQKYPWMRNRGYDGPSNNY